MKKSYWITGGIVLALVLMGASFYGGTLYERYTQTRTRTSFYASRGLSGNGGMSGTPGATGASGGQFSGGSTGLGGGSQGQVKSIEGNTLTLSTAQNVTTVTLSDSTTVLKSVAGAIADLKVGDRVRVTGKTDSNGNITATQITVLAEGGSPEPAGNGGPYPAPTAKP
jgi:hypothetical protein